MEVHSKKRREQKPLELDSGYRGLALHKEENNKIPLGLKYLYHASRNKLEQRILNKNTTKQDQNHTHSQSALFTGFYLRRHSISIKLDPNFFSALVVEGTSALTREEGLSDPEKGGGSPSPATPGGIRTNRDRMRERRELASATCAGNAARATIAASIGFSSGSEPCHLEFKKKKNFVCVPPPPGSNVCPHCSALKLPRSGKFLDGQALGEVVPSTF